MTSQKPAFKKINHPNYDLESLQHAMEHIPEEQGDPTGPSLGRDALRAVFEKSYAKQLDLTPSKGTNSYYANSGTEVMYRAFLHSVKEMRRAIGRSTRRPKGEPKKELYINGMMVADGTIQFARRPRIYRGKDDCITEANRLHESYGHLFMTFEAIYQAGNVACPVDKSKQKANGAPRLNPYKVMEKLHKVREIWKAMESGQEDHAMPSLINSNTDGTSFVYFENPQKYPMISYSSYADALYAVNGYIKAFLRATQPEPEPEPQVQESK